MRVPAAISFPSFIPPETLEQPVKSDIMLNFGQVPRLGIQIVLWIPPGALDQPVKSKLHFQYELTVVLCLPEWRQDLNFFHHYTLLNPPQLSALSLLPTILALVDRDTESVDTCIKGYYNLENVIFVGFQLLHQVSSILSATLASEGCILFFPEAPDPKIGPYAIRWFVQLCLERFSFFSQVWILQGTCVHARQVCIFKTTNQENLNWNWMLIVQLSVGWFEHGSNVQVSWYRVVCFHSFSVISTPQSCEISILLHGAKFLN